MPLIITLDKLDFDEVYSGVIENMAPLFAETVAKLVAILLTIPEYVII